MSEYIPVNYAPVPATNEALHATTHVRYPQKVRGIGKLGLRLLGVLLTDNRRTTVTQLPGTLLPEVIESGAQTLSGFRALAAIALSDAVDQLKTADTADTPTDLDEQLASASLVGVAYSNNDQTHINMTIEVVPVSGPATQLTLPIG